MINIQRIQIIILIFLNLLRVVFNTKYEQSQQYNELQSEQLSQIQQQQEEQLYNHNLQLQQSTIKRNLLNKNIIINPLVFSLYDQDTINQQTFNLESIIFDFVTLHLYSLLFKINYDKTIELMNTNNPSQSIANITMDFRQLQNYSLTKEPLTYNEDWDVKRNNYCFNLYIINNINQLVQFILGENLSADNLNQDGIKMPDNFNIDMLNYIKIHKFNLYSMLDQKLAIVIRLKNSMFYSMRLQFLNTISIDIIHPQRAIYNQTLSFAFYISSQEIALPVNSIYLDSQSQAQNYLLSYEENFYNSTDFTRANITNSTANTIADIYFRSKKGVFMPHIPYFSNCREFGSMGFFYEITESVDNCNLVDPKDVKVINPFTFGDKPKSDECQDVLFNCTFDEYPKFQANSQTWLQQPQKTVLFQMTPNPINFNANGLNTDEYSDEELINIETASEIPSGKLPTKISLNINYYQTSPTEKQIISGTVTFERFIEPTKDQQYGQTSFVYELGVSFHSMTQSELTIAFQLDIQVYLVMYIIVGSISLSSICIFGAYHALVRRYITIPLLPFKPCFVLKNRKKEKIRTKIFQCIKLIYPSALYGTYLTIIPLYLVLVLNLLIMGGQLWDYPFNFLNCDPKAGNCELSIFDIIRDNLNLSDDGMKNLRNGRCAVSIVVIGIYIMNLCADLLIPQGKNKVDTMLGQVSFDGNVWFKKFWEKSYFLCFYFAMTAIMQVIINWSLSDNFGENVWYYLCTLKILGMLSEMLGSKFFSKEHLLAPISTGLDCVLDIATLGANDFFDFLLSFYIEQGIQMLERTYVTLIMDYCEEYITDKYTKFKTIIAAAWEKNYIEDQEENMPDYLSTIVRRKIDEISMSNSNIVLSDHFEDSFETENNNKYDSLDYADGIQKPTVNLRKLKDFTSKKLIPGKTARKQFNKLIQQLQHESSFDETKDYDPTEIYLRSNLDGIIEMKQLQKKQQQELEKKEESEKQQKEALFKSIKSLKQKEDIDTTSNECVFKYSEFVNGMIGPLVLPIIVAECWMFYDQNNLATDYNIERKSYIYYFLFSIIIIPFRIAIDIVYFHIFIAYHDVDFSFYAEKVKKRFQNRREIWKADQSTSESEDEIDGSSNNNGQGKEDDSDSEEDDEEEEIKDLDKWCFSSQYYFVQAFFLIGMMQVVIGVYGITSSQYNLFRDTMLFPIILLWIVMCMFVKKLCIFVGKHIGVWKVKQQQNPSDANSQQESQKSEEDNDQQNDKKTEDDIEMRLFQMNRQQILQSKMEKEKEKKEHFQKLAQNLEKTQFDNANFRKNFILSNKQWLKNNISKILNKETKQQFRDLILEQMEGIDIKLKQKRNLKKYLLMRKLKGIRKGSYLMDKNKEDNNKQKKNNKNKRSNDDQKEDYSENEYDESLYDFESDELLQESQRRGVYGQIEVQVKPNRPSEIPYATKTILKYWLSRSKNYKKACTLIGGVVDRNMKQTCVFCGSTWGLICQPEKNAEDLFLLYLKKINQKNIYSDKQKDGWQDFYQQNCQFRTECISCNSIITDNFYKNQAEIKQQQQQQAQIQKRELSRKASGILGDLVNPTSSYMNFIYDNENINEEDDHNFKKTTSTMHNILQTDDDRMNHMKRTNTIISFQNRPSVIQSDDNDGDQSEQIDDFSMFKKQYQFENNNNNNNKKIEEFNPRKYIRQASLSRFRLQTTPSQTFRDSYQDGSKNNLLSMNSNSRLPFVTQQTQDNLLIQQSQNDHLNTEQEEILTSSIDGKQPQQQQQYFHKLGLSHNNIDSRKTSNLLGVSGISQIKTKHFSDFEGEDDDNNNNSYNTSYNKNKNNNEEDLGKNKFDTERGLIQEMNSQQPNNNIINNNNNLRIKGLLQQQNTFELNNEDEQQIIENKQKNLSSNKISNATSGIYSESSDDYKLIQNNDSQVQFQNNIINNLNNHHKIINSISNSQDKVLDMFNSQNQQIIEIKLANFCKIWKKIAQNRLLLENQQLHTEEL